MTAGRRDQLITFQDFTATQDAAGEEVQVWADIGQEWAAVYYGRGSERRQAAAEEGQQAATFQVLSNATTSSVTLQDRIILDGWIWDLVGISPDTPKRGLIEFTATATGDEWLGS
jgi:head-tail adaptor